MPRSLNRWLITAGLVFSSVAANQAPSNQIAVFGNGAGPSEVSVMIGSAEADSAGPEALTVDSSGEIFLLDSLGHRVVSDRGRVIELAVGSSPRDLVAVGSSLFVLDLDGTVSAVGNTNSTAGGIAAISVSKMRSAQAQFNQLTGPSHSYGGGGGLSAVGTSAILSQTGESITFTVTRSDGTATVHVEQGAKALDLAVPLHTRTAHVAFLGTDLSGSYYILVEQLESERGPLVVSSSIESFLPSGEKRSSCNIPIANSEYLPTRYFTITPAGKILFAFVDSAGVKISDACSAAETTLGPLEVEQPATDAHEERGEPGGLASATTSSCEDAASTVDQISRTSVLETAEAYSSIRWLLEDKNYHGSELSRCSPPFARWSRPAQLHEMIGKEVRGMPYSWGHKDSLKCFRDHLELGWIAGNSCTCTSGCVRADSVGIDCSGFVSRTWSINPTGTSGLAARADPISFDELKAGDALDKYNHKRGNHVRLFVGTKNGLVDVYESSLSCGGVCRNTLPLSQFNRYSPLRRKGVLEN